MEQPEQYLCVEGLTYFVTYIPYILHKSCQWCEASVRMGARERLCFRHHKRYKKCKNILLHIFLHANRNTSYYCTCIEMHRHKSRPSRLYIMLGLWSVLPIDRQKTSHNKHLSPAAVTRVQRFQPQMRRRSQTCHCQPRPSDPGAEEWEMGRAVKRWLNWRCAAAILWCL